MNDYCFCVSWSDVDEHVEPHVIPATTRDEAWAKLCDKMFLRGWGEEPVDPDQPAPDCHVELQFVRPHSDNRHKTCKACNKRLGPNPVLHKEYYYHEECCI